MTRDPVLSVSSVTRRFGRGSSAVTAVRDATLCVLAGDVVSIMGPSGSGKSTLLCLMGGLLVPDSGRVEIGGQVLRSLSAPARSRLRRSRIGFVFQRFNLLRALTAVENVEIGLHLAGCSRSERRKRAGRSLERFGLGACADRLPRELSGGEQQRVAIARALAPSPDLILADEPTGNLDSANGQAAIEMLRAHARLEGAAVVIVTHDRRVAASMTRRLWMEDGVLQKPDHAEPDVPASRAG